MSMLKLREVGSARVLGFDVENRPLAYWYDGATTSEITAIGWKWRDEPEPHVMLLCGDGCFAGDDGMHLTSSEAYELFRGVLTEAGIVYGHNIRRHDLPLFQSGLLRLEMEPLGPVLTCDTLRDYPRRKDMSASLASLASMYGLEGEKLAMSQPDWEQANRLTDDGLELARERVVSDVLLQENLRDRLLGLKLLSTPKVWS